MDNHQKKDGTKRQKRLLAVLVLIQVCLVVGYLYFQANYWSRDTLYVIYQDSDRVMGSLSPYGPGFEKELVARFCAQNGFKARWIRVESFNEGLGMLQSGRGQLFISEAINQDAGWDRVTRGPGYLSNQFMVTHHQWRFPLRSIADLCSNRVVIPPKQVLSSKISRLESELGCEISLTPSPGSGQNLFALLADRENRFGLVDKLNFKLWHGFFPEVHRTYSFDTDYHYAWLWSAKYRDLDKLFVRFWEDMEDNPDFLDLKDRYFGFFPSEQDSYQIRHFVRAIESRLPLYAETILEASRIYGIDPLLLVALIYQESHFDPEAESRTGVRGLLQLTLDTADFLGVQNRLDPEQSIMGGAMYLDFLLERVEDMGVTSWDKWFFTLAAYNQGLGHLYDAMELARRENKSSRSWTGLKEVYPLLSYRRYFETLPRGYARGFEAVTFVENIRFYYYLLYGMISISRPEVEHLGGFLGFVPDNWPD